MKAISASGFIASLNDGVHKFENITVIGDVDFGKITLAKLVLSFVKFDGHVNGSVTIGEISITSETCHYWSNVTPLCYAGTLIKDLSD